MMLSYTYFSNNSKVYRLSSLVLCLFPRYFLRDIFNCFSNGFKYFFYIFMKILSFLAYLDLLKLLLGFVLKLTRLNFVNHLYFQLNTTFNSHEIKKVTFLVYIQYMCFWFHYIYSILLDLCF